MVFNRKALMIVLVLVLSLSAFAVNAQDDGTPISYGDVITSELTEDTPEEFYTFEGSAGDVIDLSMVADFDTYLFLFDSDGNEVERDDDGGVGFDSRILAFELPANDVYTIRATSYGYRDFDADDIRTGDYTLSLNVINLTLVDMNSTVSASFGDGDQVLYFSFSANDGDVIDFIVNSGNVLDTRMTIINPFGSTQAEVDDAPGSVDPALFEEPLNGDGDYIVIVEAQNPNATLSGEITLTVGVAELASLDAGPITVDLNSDNDTQVVTFEATRGDIVRIEIRVISRSDFASPFIEVLQNQENVATISGASGVDYLAFEILFTEDGPVNLSIRSFSDFEAEISIAEDEE